MKKLTKKQISDGVGRRSYDLLSFVSKHESECHEQACFRVFNFFGHLLFECDEKQFITQLKAMLFVYRKEVHGTQRKKKRPVSNKVRKVNKKLNKKN